MEKWRSIAEKPDEDCAAIYKIRLTGKDSITRLIGETNKPINPIYS